MYMHIHVHVYVHVHMYTHVYHMQIIQTHIGAQVCICPACTDTSGRASGAYCTSLHFTETRGFLLRLAAPKGGRFAETLPKPGR